MTSDDFTQDEPSESSRERPWYRRKRVLVPPALGLLAVVGLLGAGSDTSKPKAAAASLASTTSWTGYVTTLVPETTTTEAPVYDIKFATSKGCTTDSVDFVHASGTITNLRSVDLSFTIHVTYLDRNGVRLGDGIDYVNDLHGGQTATWEALLGETPDPGTCHIDNVEVSPY